MGLNHTGKGRVCLISKFSGRFKLGRIWIKLLLCTQRYGQHWAIADLIITGFCYANVMMHAQGKGWVCPLFSYLWRRLNSDELCYYYQIRTKIRLDFGDCNHGLLAAKSSLVINLTHIMSAYNGQCQLRL